MTDRCKTCKEEIKGNAGFILKILTSLGYEEAKFCNKSCIRRFINKKGFWEKMFGK